MHLLSFFGGSSRANKINPARAVQEVVSARKAVEKAAADLRDAATGLGETIERTLTANAKVTGRKRK